jgi:hypothetical protein
LEDIHTAADQFVKKLESCEFWARKIFSHLDNEKLNDYNKILRRAKSLRKISKAALRARPPLTPSRLPDFALAVPVTFLARCWCRLTGNKLSRSTNHGSTPQPFISTVLVAMNIEEDPKRIDSTLHWLLKLRKKDREQLQKSQEKLAEVQLPKAIT